ncbi:MAG: rod shape-determining protein RodA [Syntrophales bacterium]|nr:rod shape-determining protein RodA [Syntrophales bacterium]
MKFDRRLLLNFDWILLMIVVAICGIGILNIYSAGISLTAAKAEPIYVKQFIWFLVGLAFMLVSFGIDYRLINQYSYPIYIFSIALLVVLFLFGEITLGTQRWFVIAGFSFQPSELVKLTLILALSKYFCVQEIEGDYNLRRLWLPAVMVVFPFLLIMKQPDLGTAMVLIITFVSMVLFVGIRLRSLITVVTSGLLLAPVCWMFLKDYQKERIMTFLDPEMDPLGSGYHIIQSIIAVGSGGFLGKGFLKGTQSQLRFLPEHQTDFIFSVFAEEWGFIGGSLLLILFLALILWGLRIAQHSRDLLGTLIAFGITMLLFWEVLINIGMVLGIVPVVGIPLPFLSYGGSSLVVLMTAVGLLMNISVRRYMLQR